MRDLSEHLYRGKRNDDGDRGGWVYGSLLHRESFVPGKNGKKGFFMKKYSIDIGNPFCIGVFPETVGYFTGRMAFKTDWKGKKIDTDKIFEDDIIKICSSKPRSFGLYLIYWDKDKCGFSQKWLSGTRIPSDEADSIEVVGNTHDNPEMLDRSC